jgi:DNA modification methylase
MARGVRILKGDCLKHLPRLPANSIDAIVCDPPYGLEFMGKEWDAPWKYGFQAFGFADKKFRRAAPSFASNRNPMCKACRKHKRGSKNHQACKCDIPQFDDVDHRISDLRRFQAWCELWAKEALRVLKPGGHLIAFGGTRTYHRMACAIEDAGFEIRDQIGWCYGSGFPKSRNIGNGRGTALKPAWEPIVLARKPLSERTVAANVLKWGTGALNIDACRVEGESGNGVWGTNNKTCQDGRMFNGSPKGETYRSQKHPQGRWPANLCHDGSDEVVALFPQQKGGGAPARRRSDKFSNTFGAFKGERVEGSGVGPTSGSAARFFYCAKASKKERNGSKHPTIKPLALIRYLVRLVTPPGGTVLDPFAGSGTTGQAAKLEGCKAVLIEREPEYHADIKQRLKAA